MTNHNGFGSDRPLLFNVEPWGKLGFGVANFGDNYGTLCAPIHGLADELGKSQLFLMTHVDAIRLQPPSRNTIERICKLVNRVQTVLVGRMKSYNEVRLEEGHASANAIPWMIHPAPYFAGPFVRNRWMREYNNLMMVALTNIYQHSDNNLGLTITEQFARDIWKYFNEIKIRVATELLLLSPETVKADGFIFDETHFDQYDPSGVILNYEPLDTPGSVYTRATEDDLRELFRGIPANEIVTMVAEYQVDAAELGRQGQPIADEAALRGVSDGSLVGRTAGDIGRPQM